jgi:hypothetical protein
MQSDISAARLEGAEAEFMHQYEPMAPRSAAVNPSLNNLVRAGLQPRYARQNWVWHSGGSL